MSDFKELVKKIHASAVKKKFWDKFSYLNPPPNDKKFFEDCDSEKYKNQAFDLFEECPRFLALIISEVVEALEEHRVSNFAKFKIELAHVLMRTFDLFGGMGIGIEEISEIIEGELEKNKNRLEKHGKKY